MQRVFAILILVLIASPFYAWSGGNIGLPAPGQQQLVIGNAPPNYACQNIQQLNTEFTQATRDAGVGGRSTREIIERANDCQEHMEQDFSETLEFCDRGEGGSCGVAYANERESLREEKREAKDDVDEMENKVEQVDDDLQDLREKINDNNREKAEKENDILERMNTAQQEYEDAIGDDKAQAVQQINEIQQRITDIINNNRALINQANRAMAQIEADKRNARTQCLAEARKRYTDRLAALEEELNRRGRRVGGGTEGAQNLRRYKTWLQQVIANPEGTEQFNLCYLGGDAVDNALKASGINGALSLNEISGQIEANNTQRTELVKQLEQQQTLMNETQQRRFQQFQRKITQLNAEYQRLLRTHAETEANLKKRETELQQRQTRYQNELRRRTNAYESLERRYDCARDLSRGATAPPNGAFASLVGIGSRLESACNTAPAECSGMCPSGTTDGASGSGTRRGSRR